ncbi:MAG: hypothetical protein V1794_08920 [Candidatus Glassbacteria bacterium]
MSHRDKIVSESGGRHFNRREVLELAAAGLIAGGIGSCSLRDKENEPESLTPFQYRVSVGWLRDLASEPTPGEIWPCIRWDDKLTEDQLGYLKAEAELGMNYDCAWGLFRARDWPVPFENVIDDRRAERLKIFVEAAHRLGVKILAGVGVYSWQFDEVIRKVPGVSAGDSHSMCPQKEPAWDWMRRVLDYHLEPAWGLDGISMQSADLGRCECPECSRMSPAEHHALVLTRSAEYVRQNRPDWNIGQASWGLRVDQESEFPYVKKISGAVDYMVEVDELSAKSGRRAAIIAGLGCAFGSLGGVFLEPPQHWDRLRWFVPCGLGSAGTLARLRQDGGLACEYFYRPFANPVEEVSWRTGAKILSAPSTPVETALADAINAVYGATGQELSTLAEWFSRGELAYFSRVKFKPGDGSISLEPLIWKEDPAAAGPPVYLQRITPENRPGYAMELRELKNELTAMAVPNREAVDKTLECIDGTLNDLAGLA